MSLGTITPTETMTNYALIGGVAAGVGGILLAQQIKTKTAVPVTALLTWAGILGIATIVSVVVISRSSK